MLTNRLSASRRIYITVMRVLLVLAAVLTAALVVFTIVYVLSKGLPYVTWHLLSTKPSYVSGTIGILPDICNTVQILLASLLIVLPLGVGAAVYLTEYAQNKKLVAAIEYAAETRDHHRIDQLERARQHVLQRHRQRQPRGHAPEGLIAQIISQFHRKNTPRQKYGDAAPRRYPHEVFRLVA